MDRWQSDRRAAMGPGELQPFGQPVPRVAREEEPH